MNCVKDIIPVLLYRGVSKDHLRRIIRAVASEESRDFPILVNNKTASCNLTDIRQSSTVPHIHTDSKTEGDLLHQSLINKPKSTNHVNSKNSSPPKTLAKRMISNSQSLNEMALPSTKKTRPEEQEKSFCIVVTLKNNLKKQAEARRETFSYLNENLLRDDKSRTLSIEDLAKNQSHTTKSNVPPINTFMKNDENRMSKSNKELGSFAISKHKKSTKPRSTKKDMNINYIHLYSFEKHKDSGKHFPETIKKDSTHSYNKDSEKHIPMTIKKDNHTYEVKNPLFKQDSETTENCILSPEENSEYQNYTCEPRPKLDKKKETKGQVKELSDIDYIQTDIKNKNLELTRLSEKDLKKCEKVMRHSEQLFNVGKLGAPVTQSPHSDIKINFFKDVVKEPVSKNVKISEPVKNFNFFSKKEIENKKSLYEQLQSDKIFVNALSSVPQKPNALNKSNSEPQRNIEVPPLRYIYMDRLNENMTVDDCILDKNNLLQDTKNYLQLTSRRPMNDPNLSHYGYVKSNFWSENTSNLKPMKHNYLKFPYKHFQRDDREVNRAVPVPQAEKTQRKLYGKIKTDKTQMKKRQKVQIRQISKPTNLLSNRTVKVADLPDYTPSSFFLSRTVFANSQIDSTRMGKQFDKHVFVNYKIDLKPFNNKKETKNRQNSNNSLHMTHLKKQKNTNPLTESFSTQYRKIENDRYQQIKQFAYSRGVY